MSVTERLEAVLAWLRRKDTEIAEGAFQYSSGDFNDAANDVAEAVALLRTIVAKRYELQTRVAWHNQEWKKTLDERDAALAELKEEAKQRDFYRESYHVTLARAEAAEESKRARAADHVTLTDLRARIETLADDMDSPKDVPYRDAIRALLNLPAKETALDVLAECEALVQIPDELSTALAKLRTLLEPKP